jgi:hypothetical protein
VGILWTTIIGFVAGVIAKFEGNRMTSPRPSWGRRQRHGRRGDQTYFGVACYARRQPGLLECILRGSD